MLLRVEETPREANASSTVAAVPTSRRASIRSPHTGDTSNQRLAEARTQTPKVLKIAFVAVLYLLPIPQVTVGQDADKPEIGGVCPDAVLAGLLQTVIVRGNFPSGTTFTVDGAAPIGASLLSNSHAALKVKLTKGTHKVVAKANGFESGQGDIIAIGPGDVLLVPLPDLAACGSELVRILRETHDIKKTGVANALDKQYGRVQSDISSSDLQSARRRLTHEISSLIDAQTGKSISEFGATVLNQFNDTLEAAIVATECLHSEPPKAELTVKVPEEEETTRRFNFRLKTETQNHKGTFEVPFATGKLEMKTVDLETDGKACCTPCADFFFYRGALDPATQVNEAELFKCGPVVAMIGVKKKEPECGNCNIFAINILESESFVKTPREGAATEEKMECEVDTNPARLSATYPLFFTDKIKPKGLDSKLDGADTAFVDFPGPAMLKAKMVENADKFKSWKIVQKFRTWYFCDRRAEKKPPCVLGSVGWGHTIEVTFDADKDTFSCKVSDLVGPDCKTGEGLDDCFKKALDKFVEKVKAHENFTTKKKEEQQKILDKFEELKKAEACPKGK